MAGDLEVQAGRGVSARGLRIRLVATHPIQYQAPLFRAVAARSAWDFQVWYCHRATAEEQGDAGFGVPFEWDVPLLDGYESRFLENAARRPGLHRFGGLSTPAMGDLLRRDRPDALIVQGWFYRAAWQAIVAAWRQGIPVLMRGDSILPRGVLTPRSFMTGAARRAFVPRFDACLAVGGRSREYFEHYGARPDRVFVVPHTIDAARLAAEAVRGEPCRKRWRAEAGFDDSTTVFVLAAKLVDVKRPLDFVEAVARAARTARVAGLIAGDGPLRQACERRARDRQAPVKFLGFVNQSEIARAYVTADALVLPSDSETWGLVVNEAHVCGRAAIVSDAVGCAPDLIEPGRTGVVVPPRDPAALADAMIRLAADPSRLAAMGMEAQRRAVAWSPDRVADALLHALDRTLDERRSTP